jgi:hypothetical protein
MTAEENYIPQTGDVIEWCDELYYVIKGGNNYGSVIPIGDAQKIKFYWTLHGESSKFVRKMTDKELKETSLQF